MLFRCSFRQTPCRWVPLPLTMEASWDPTIPRCGYNERGFPIPRKMGTLGRHKFERICNIRSSFICIYIHILYISDIIILYHTIIYIHVYIGLTPHPTTVTNKGLRLGFPNLKHVSRHPGVKPQLSVTGSNHINFGRPMTRLLMGIGSQIYPQSHTHPKCV